MALRAADEFIPPLQTLPHPIGQLGIVEVDELSRAVLEPDDVDSGLMDSCGRRNGNSSAPGQWISVSKGISVSHYVIHIEVAGLQVRINDVDVTLDQLQELIGRRES